MSIIAPDSETSARMVSVDKTAKVDNQEGKVISESQEQVQGVEQASDSSSSPLSQRDKSSQSEQSAPVAEPQGGLTREDQQGETTQETLEKAVENLNNYMKSLQRDLEFNIDDDSGRTIIKVIDKSTNEIVRVLPPEEANQLAKGIETSPGNLGAIIDLST